MSNAPVPDLFASVPAALFAPLSGELAPVYWSILARFYACEFEREPFFLAKPAAAGIVEEVLEASGLWTTRREALLAEGSGVLGASGIEEDGSTRAAARRLLARLEGCGWIHFEYRSTHGEVLNFHPYAARILETLLRVARQEQPLFQGYAHQIASLFRPDVFAAKPGLSLFEAKRLTLEMVRELKILNRNIYAFTRRIVEEAATASGVLEQGFDRYQSAVLASYHRLKTIDNLYKWRGDILHRLDRIERDEAALEAARAWYAEQQQIDLASASESLREDLHVLRQQFETMPAVIEDLDERNARFSGIALRRLMYLLRQDRRTEGQLQRVIDALAAQDGPDVDLDVFQCELLSGDFLYTSPKARPKVQPVPLARRPAADVDRIRKELAGRLRHAFSRARVEAFVASLFGASGAATFADAPLETDEDYVRLMYVAAFGLDKSSSFRFQPPPVRGPEATLRKGRYGVPRGRLERARARK